MAAAPFLAVRSFVYARTSLAFYFVGFASMRILVVSSLLLGLLFGGASGEEPGHVSVSGIYPHLAMFNNEGECGTGAVVPWAKRLWVVTYAPHLPLGSSDKLYEITPELEQVIRPESIGGTPANRMIHTESQQLFIGPYAIDAKGDVRVIPYATMFGRPTGNARHLTDPAGKIYYATMEEGIYEVDVNTLEVTELWADEQQKSGRYAELPGYHGKGFYSGQGRMVYANNGDHAPEAKKNPAVPSGALAQWDGVADSWDVVTRNQFTEVTGPGGIYGNLNPETDPIWTIGWDHRSLIFMCLDRGQWHRYRLPKSSHGYDGAHGWNTEWPRIRDIGEDALLMTMHGAFWAFPKTFQASHNAGIAPRSNYLKVIGDFTRWSINPGDPSGDRIVFGCDDTAKNEFLNKRSAKGKIASPQSQSNLWFVEPTMLDELGPVIGRGAVWVNESVKANVASDPFLVSGYDRRSLHLSHSGGSNASIDIAVDAQGNGQWTNIQTVVVAAGQSQWLDLSELSPAVWMRLTSDRDLEGATAWFQYSNVDKRTGSAADIFAGLATPSTRSLSGGLIRARGGDKGTLSLAAVDADGNDVGYYELDEKLQLRKIDDAELLEYTKANTAIPTKVLVLDDASVLYNDDAGRRWRLPRGDASLDQDLGWGATRVAREVATERDLFNANGTFYELPADNAGGFAKVRAVATHNRRIHDFCSYRGMFVMTGIANDATHSHIIRAADGKAAVWVGAIDDAWQLGKPRGFGGPWKNTHVTANTPSDPYLMTGFDSKTLTLSHGAKKTVTIRLELDISGDGLWRSYKSFTVPAGEEAVFTFPSTVTAYWLRVVADQACEATAQLNYY
jgi:hypothetical protein